MNNNIKKYPVVLTIAGSDSGGGAGIQADLKTFSALGTYGTSAITALTAQNTMGVKGIYDVTPEFLKMQLDVVFSDIKPIAIKTGMLNTKEVVQTIAQSIDLYKPEYYILDPVMVATSGDKLLKDETIQYLINELIPKATLITPNIDEAEVLSNTKINNLDDMKAVAKELLGLGCNAVLLKGGHLVGETMYDVLQIRNEEMLILESPYIQTKNTHGTGCTLSAAITSYLALGFNLKQAVVEAKNYISKAIWHGKDFKLGEGHGPLNHFFAPLKMHEIE